MKPKPLPVDVEPWKMKVAGMNILPMVVKMFNMMSDKMRRKVVSKQNAPKLTKLARDLHDIAGENPYKIEEIVKERMWEVSHIHEDAFYTDKSTPTGMKILGIDPYSEESKAKILEGAATHGSEAVEIAKKDIEDLIKWYNKTKAGDLSQEELKMACHSKNRMFVLKLDSGSLLLYNVCKIREEYGFKAWLDGLGKVEWIVVGSCYHTNWLHGVFQQYPEAKIVGTTAAQEKIKVINGLPRNLDKFDFDLNITEDYEAAKKELAMEGVTLFYVEGEVGTNSISLVLAETLLSVDLMYGSHDGHGAFGYSLEKLLSMGDDEGGMGLRLFRFRLMSKPFSPNGTLATYRYYMMDPKSFGAMGFDQPARDGSDCQLMAKSLRKLLSLDFNKVCEVHHGKLEADDFRKSIDANWNWLDGTSLL